MCKEGGCNDDEKTILLTNTGTYGAASSGTSIKGSSHVKSTEISEEEPVSPRRFSLLWFASQLRHAYKTHSLLVSFIVAILLASVYPPIGAHYFLPGITSSWLTVMLMFFISGVCLKTEDLSRASQRIKFNVFVQSFNYIIVSLIVMAFSRALIHSGILPRNLADGMVICSCLPVTVNMILVLTTSANGDEAAAVFSAVFGVLTGTFVTPALILMYLGVQGKIDIGVVLAKLGIRVLLPLLVGQLLQKLHKPTQNFVSENKKSFKNAQEWCLLFIVYCVFCHTFEVGVDTTAGDIFLMIFLQVLVLIAVMALAWACLGVFFRDEPKLRVTGLFACTQKTVSLGVPLIGAIYEHDPNAALYTLPLIVWHPMQLVIGSALTPYLIQFVEWEERRLEARQPMLHKSHPESLV
uniref:Sodium/bile acid cotransporter n=1 Tax=Helicotheca tamesis TaxID=374047 RepID=A0A7S2HN73_9STRA|mmetsp:Transcript_19475/g.26737  ORF Transcript_19475/g.26737 Transcript_19475/m.26737 type:complete len:409 (+) Transcript_19475:39-1265(+)